ncbi:thyrotropin-releasing hormone receptor isoform X2 [Dendroctonus ponderosae]|uniref:G-protein coupled receptors family 1 profile domain-containing protein n=1 Tax=Dendroctonus ponderosae TaxID=77166 RepID=A0AAR5Q8F0_DENPD|nr:thyrotropin-releasing hormone receptor isoform X2 [Dendroctonus ponderosae]
MIAHISALATPLTLNVSVYASDVNATTTNYLYTSVTSDAVANGSHGQFGNNASYNGSLDYAGSSMLPSYIRTTSVVFCVLIMCLGVIGNVMVPIVIFKTKDMRNSTNIFLVNLSIADLMVLLVCTPTVLVEVNSPPETWVLGREMCKAVPFVELTVAHASVLTILAISFERYYAICKPLKAGYICTKARASLICILAWFIAAVFTSPILAITQYESDSYFDGSLIFVCFSMAVDLMPCIFFVGSIIVFFIIPLAILICVYALIARTLMSHPSQLVSLQTKSVSVPSQSVIKYRKQVMLMLATVVTAFFICLSPFRALTLWIIFSPPGSNFRMGLDNYYKILYFSRIMFFINSAVNPILYNIMSSKFRGGFSRLCGMRKLKRQFQNTGIIRRSTTSSTSPSTQPTSDSGVRSGRNQSRYSSSLKKLKENPKEEALSEEQAKRPTLARNVYIKAPLQIVSGTSGQKINPGAEIYV